LCKAATNAGSESKSKKGVKEEMRSGHVGVEIDEESSLGESLFIRVLGIKSPMLKVLDFLMDNESFDYSKTEIAEGTNLSRATLFKVWSKLEALELITATREVGRAKMYKLNKENPIVKKLMELDDAISEYFALKHCDPEARSSSDISRVLEPGQGLIDAIVEYDIAEPGGKKDRSKELLIA
jgi:DNA-binding transcriptional ArsR family regulator